MFEYQAVRLLHHHGNDDWVPMHASEDPASHDPERAWLAGAKVFKCTRCDEQVIIAPDDRPEFAGQSGVSDPNHP